MPRSPALNRLRFLLQFWTVAFLGASVIFLFFGNNLLITFNDLSSKLFPALMPLPLSEEKFWLSLSLSLMATLIFLCYWAQKNIEQQYFLVVPILISKFTSTFFFFVFFLAHEPSLAYFIGMIVDGGVFIITYYFYRAVQKEKGLTSSSEGNT